MVTSNLFVWLIPSSPVLIIIVFFEKQPGTDGGALVGNLKTSLINVCTIIVGTNIAIMVAIIGTTAISAGTPMIGIAATINNAAILAARATKIIIIKLIIFKKSDFNVKYAPNTVYNVPLSVPIIFPNKSLDITVN